MPGAYSQKGLAAAFNTDSYDHGRTRETYSGLTAVYNTKFLELLMVNSIIVLFGGKNEDVSLPED